jgi:uncharacterized damage-inducible protein DinB
MAQEYARTATFPAARFTESDLNGATFRDCDLRNVRITSSAVDDMRISGFDGRAGTVVVDDVVVTDFVAAELLPEDLRHERVHDEWSLVETLRHLVFAIDSWVGRVVLGEPAPFHRLALPHTDLPADAPAQIGIEADARPSYAEVVAAHAARRDEVRAVVAAITDDELEQVRTGTAMPGMEDGPFTVGTCLRVVLNEHSAHRRYAVRDLAALEARMSTPTWQIPRVTDPRATGTPQWRRRSRPAPSRCRVPL